MSELKAEEYHVYIIKDELGDVHYVGMTGNFESRLKNHKCGIMKEIGGECEMISVCKLSDRDIALRTELSLIKSYKAAGAPLKNKHRIRRSYSISPYVIEVIKSYALKNEMGHGEVIEGLVYENINILDPERKIKESSLYEKEPKTK